MDVRSIGIIERDSAVRINYRKWVGPSIDTVDPSHSEFHGWTVNFVFFFAVDALKYLLA